MVKERIEYYARKLAFIGEFLNGKRWNGKGIEYNDKDNFKLYEVEYFKGGRK